MNARRLPRLRIAAYVKLPPRRPACRTLLSACRHAGDITARMAAASMPSAATARSLASRPAPATLPCSIRRTAAIRARSTSSRRSPTARLLPGFRRRCRFHRHLHRHGTAPRCRPGARRSCLPYFDVALQGGTNIVAKQVGQVGLHFPAGSQLAPDHARRRQSGSIALRRRLPANVRADPHPRAQGRARPTPRSIRWPTRRSAPRSPRRPSSIWSASSSTRTSSSTTQRVKTSPKSR